MKYIYTLFIALFVFVIGAQAQVTIDISPKCAGANQQLILTVSQVSGKGFNGSTTITVNGQKVSYTKDNNNLSVTVPADVIATAGNYQVVASTANEVSDPSILTIVGMPNATSVASCGRATITASGAPAGATYHWYTQATGGNTIATGATYTTTTSGQFYVAMSVTGACESSRRLVIANINTIPTAPRATNVSRCGAGSVSLSATGAPAGGGYRWYSAPTAGTLLSSAATYTTSSLTATTTYYVSAVSADGCESARVPVTATIVPKYTGLTEFAQQSLAVGKPAVLQLNSDVFKNGHGVRVRLESYNYITKVRKDLGTTEAPKNGDAAFLPIAIVESDTYYEAFIEIVTGVCYDEYLLTATTQGIVSLPVELVSFKAQQTTDGVQLSWKTASERDNKGFDVEVSVDGRNFKKIAFVESKVGTTSLTQHYSFLDTRAAAGTNYYRLKQVDFDGAFEYSKTVAVNLSQAIASAVYPTMATTDITVRLASAEEQVTIAVADMAGKQLLAVQNPAERQVVLPVQQLQQGVYFVTVTSGTQKEVFRFVKR